MKDFSVRHAEDCAARLGRGQCDCEIQFANTEPKPASTSLAVAKRAEASEGPERTDNKPLMRNPSADEGHPDRQAASDTFDDAEQLDIDRHEDARHDCFMESALEPHDEPLG